MPDEMKHIVKCKHCGRFEYYGEMRWLNGRCECRDCYRHHYEEIHHKRYEWNDLDGHRPTEEEYIAQEDEHCDGCNSKTCNGCEHQH